MSSNGMTDDQIVRLWRAGCPVVCIAVQAWDRERLFRTALRRVNALVRAARKAGVRRRA